MSIAKSANPVAANVEYNCDQATNEMSSVDKIPPSTSPPPTSSSSSPQPHQNAMESGGKNAKTAEEDEDEDRKTNHMYPYSSISSSHKHNGNDDDDDCNSSEDTKTSCSGVCVSPKTEQPNGQQQQVLIINGFLLFLHLKYMQINRKRFYQRNR